MRRWRGPEETLTEFDGRRYTSARRGHAHVTCRVVVTACDSRVLGRLFISSSEPPLVNSHG